MTATRDAPDWPPWVQTWILPYVEEATLWPVLFALLGHVVVIMAPMMLFVNRHGSVKSLVGLIGLGLLSAALIRFEIRYRRRPAGITLALLLTWISSAALAWLSDYYGVF
jgi:hypothetical protein